MIKSDELIQELVDKTQINIAKAEKFRTLSIEELNWKTDEQNWSILECLKHLNLYGDFYIPEITTRIENSNTSHKENFKTGFLGNYFAKSMLPREKLNKMKTFKDKNPIGSNLDLETIDQFITQQNHILKLLDNSRKIDLNKTKTSISISKWIKLRIGDTFRIVVYHNDRHVEQAIKVLKG